MRTSACGTKAHYIVMRMFACRTRTHYTAMGTSAAGKKRIILSWTLTLTPAEKEKTALRFVHTLEEQNKNYEHHTCLQN
jgi:hypothetical protein